MNDTQAVWSKYRTALALEMISDGKARLTTDELSATEKTHEPPPEAQLLILRGRALLARENLYEAREALHEAERVLLVHYGWSERESGFLHHLDDKPIPARDAIRMVGRATEDGTKSAFYACWACGHVFRSYVEEEARRCPKCRKKGKHSPLTHF